MDEYFIPLNSGFSVNTPRHVSIDAPQATHIIANDSRSAIEAFIKGISSDEQPVTFIELPGGHESTPTALSGALFPHRIYCMDLRRSRYITARNLGDEDANRHKMVVIRKLALDRRKLLSVPLRRRLMFRLGEMEQAVLFHKQVVDAMREEPSSMRFVATRDWDSSMLGNGFVSAARRPLEKSL